MATSPAFVGTPTSAAAVVSTANTNKDGTGTIATIFTAGVLGARVDAVDIKATGTTVAGTVLLFRDDTGLGTSWRSINAEATILAVTSSTTAPASGFTVVFQGGLTLRAGALLGASTTIAQAFHVSVRTGGSV